MKEIPRKNYPGATRLSPMELHFKTFGPASGVAPGK